MTLQISMEFPMGAVAEKDILARKAFAIHTMDPITEGLEIQYGVLPSTFGPLLFAYTKLGVCWVSFIEHHAGIDLIADEVDALRDYFPTAQLKAWDKGQHSPEIQAIIAYLMGENSSLPSLQFHLKGSDFQRLVWEQLLLIPRGAYRSYGHVALSMDIPTATRAVASAIGKNPIAVLIPCHRVLRKDGQIGGYRWGIPQKLALLDWERGQINGTNSGAAKASTTTK